MDQQAHTYHPAHFRGLSWLDALPAFANGSDTPRAYLERCLEVMAAREPVVRAFVTVNEAGARQAADASTARWKAGQALSPLDGMPIGIKDLLETRDMPTEMGCEAYRGNHTGRDNAAVWALREAGAVILGKTVTAELGGANPGPTTNPFDAGRTPGGSSSGSAAAVGARMVPAAIGTQVGGSIIRPASFCGNFALKPTQGAITRGERQATSQSTSGPHAATLEDCWQVAIEITKRAGGDPGQPGLMGPDTCPEARRPGRLVVLETEGWARLDDASRTAFEMLLEQMAAAGITLLRRRDHAWIETLERRVDGASAYGNAITRWENRWAQRALVEKNPDGVSQRAKNGLAAAEAMRVADYQAALRERAEAQAAYAAVMTMADAVVTLSSVGPAPVWSGDVPGQKLNPRPTGDIAFNAPASAIFCPAVTLPLMGVGGLPVGLQVMGAPHRDADAVGVARWLMGNLAPVAV